MIKIKTALVSVSNKQYLEKLAQKLHNLNVEIIATKGTQKFLKQFDIPSTSIDDITHHPEAFQGRIKTLSFEISGALLHRRNNDEDLQEVKKWNIRTIDMVICNLYPFNEENHTIEDIDIGGPTMIRSSAKNHDGVAIVTSPDQYFSIIDELEDTEGYISKETRSLLAQEAFKLTYEYDQTIYSFLNTDRILKKDLRYGENPHQKASLRLNPFEEGIAHAKVIQGKALSYNNLLDADAAWKCTQDVQLAASKYHPQAAQVQSVVIVKHLNPCGVASGINQLECLQDAWEGDPTSSFGSIICFSNKVKADTAKWLESKFIELVIAPEIEAEALTIFSKKKNLRVLTYPVVLNPEKTSTITRSISGGILYQDEDQNLDQSLQVVTEINFPETKKLMAHFGIMITKHLKSNAIALVQKKGSNWQLIGTGMGQPNRIESFSRLSFPRAIEKNHSETKEMVLISDAFFPFADMVIKASEFQIKYIVQPGGSIRDQEVIAACNQNNISMIFTQRRHFRH